MNPLNLLTKGRTFRLGKDRTGTYKLPSGSLVPRFDGKKKSASSHPNDEKQRDSGVGPIEDTEPRKEVQVPLSSIRQERPKSERAAKVGMRKRIAEFLAHWFKTKEAARPLSVQTELKLDHVTVIRNDLNEGDVEIVAAAGTKKRPVLPVISEEPAVTKP